MNEDPNHRNGESLKTLIRSIRLFQGDFSLILAHCNYDGLRCQMVQQLRAQSPIPIEELVLEPSVTTLYGTITQILGGEQPQALMVSGLESVIALDKLLSATNQVREEFRHFNFPLIVWVTDEVLQKLIRLIPDFHSWSTTIKFANTTEALISSIEKITDQIFIKLIEIGVGTFIDSTALNIQAGSRRRAQLESALEDLRDREVNLSTELAASLEFVLGQDSTRSLSERWQHYQQSLALWQEAMVGGTSQNLETEAEDLVYLFPNLSPDSPGIERIGCLWYYMGLWWRSYGVDNHPEYEAACNRSRVYFEQLIGFFQYYQRQDLEAKFINAWGEVLQRLERWEELASVAQHSLSLHQALYSQDMETEGQFGTGDGFRLAHDYLLLADIALAKSDWEQARSYARQAITTHQTAQEAILADLEPHKYFNWRNQYHQELYYLALARALAGLGLNNQAIAKLELVRKEGNPQFDPRLYLRILRNLQALYYEQGEYLKSFELKQQQQVIAQQYGFCPFVGASYLQPLKTIATPALPGNQNLVRQELAAIGWQQDVEQLITRIKRNDCKLTIVHGQPKVGKTSLLEAGLKPGLGQITIDHREVVTIILREYEHWIEELKSSLDNVTKVDRVKEGVVNPLEHVMDNLRQNGQENLLTVLIFDQLEEFFLTYSKQETRQILSQFLGECLEIPYVKLILCIRENQLSHVRDFAPHWREQVAQENGSSQDCVENLATPDSQSISDDIFYQVDYFDLPRAKLAIENLTFLSQYPLKYSLIEQLTKDLQNELGQIKPLELQLVGLQLQTDKITTLGQYFHRGGKAALIEEYTREIISDCGKENGQIAQSILSLLESKPMTKDELSRELTSEELQLDLVLEILVASGLILQGQDLPESYQLSFLKPYSQHSFPLGVNLACSDSL